MRLEHSFTVPVPVDDAWQVLLDLPRVAPCMPGATLTGQDGDSFTGTVKVKLGPIGLTYQGKGRFVEHDEAAHRVVIEASGRDTRSAGTATASVTAQLVPEGDTTRANVVTDLTVTGRPAQFGRGMISEVGEKLIDQFAGRLAETLTGPTTPAAGVAGAPAGEAEAPAPQQPAPQPVAPQQPDGPPEPEPIDLLRMTVGTASARRVAGYALAVVLVLLFWRLLCRRLWRRRSNPVRPPPPAARRRCAEARP
jgi:uncharacterized protein